MRNTPCHRQEDTRSKAPRCAFRVPPYPGVPDPPCGESSPRNLFFRIPDLIVWMRIIDAKELFRILAQPERQDAQLNRHNRLAGSALKSDFTGIRARVRLFGNPDGQPEACVFSGFQVQGIESLQDIRHDPVLIAHRIVRARLHIAHMPYVDIAGGNRADAADGNPCAAQIPERIDDEIHRLVFALRGEETQARVLIFRRRAGVRVDDIEVMARINQEASLPLHGGDGRHRAGGRPGIFLPSGLFVRGKLIRPGFKRTDHLFFDPVGVLIGQAIIALTTQKLRGVKLTVSGSCLTVAWKRRERN